MHYYTKENNDKDKLSLKNDKTPWKIIIADDDHSVHGITELVFRNQSFDGRELNIINAYSGSEAKKIIFENPDTAVILLDVVMETDNAGFDVVRFIREDMDNHLLQIMLRTGETMSEPEQMIIRNYEINDFRSKTELTAGRLYTSVISMLRAYELASSYENLNRQLLEANVKLESVNRELAESKDRIAESEKNYRELVENANSIILKIDREGRIIFFNEFAQRFFGFREEDLIGENLIGTIVPPLESISTDLNKYLSNVSSDPDAYGTYENENIKADGTRVWCSWTSRQILSDDGDFVGILSIGNDVTWRKNAENLIIKQNELGQKLSAITDLDEALGLCLKTAIEMTGSDSGGVYLIDPESELIRLVCSNGVSPEFISSVSCYGKNSIADTIVRKRKPVYFSREDLLAFDNKAYKKEDLRSLAVIPIFHKNLPVACLSAGSHRREKIDEVTQRTLESLTSWLGNVILRLSIENQNRETEELYRMIMGAMNEGLVVLDSDQKIIYANRALCELIGLNSYELMNSSVIDYIDPEQYGYFYSQVRERRKGYFKPYSIRILDVTGNLKAVNVSPRSMFNDEGMFMGSLGVFTDLTEKIYMQKKVRHSEEMYKTIFESTGTAIAVMDENHVITIVNREFEKISGYDIKEIVRQKNLLDFVDKTDVKRLESFIERVKKPEDNVSAFYEFGLVNRSGKNRAVMVYVSVLPGTDNILFSLIDITILRALQRELLDISLLEQQRIGQDLHDNLGQNLTGATFLIQTIKQEVSKGIMPGLLNIEKVDNIIRNVLMKTRSISRVLYPVEMETEGFCSAIEGMAENVENVFNVQCKVIIEGEFIIKENRISLHLYYIVREAVNNSIKHGKAECITICLKKLDESFFMEISDNGIGSKKTIKKDGMGLKIIQYRATMIGAKFEIKSEEGEGFSVRVFLDA